ncbi:hypothetical protein EMCRGX_G013096 [Ephydatia muelleri]
MDNVRALWLAVALLLCSVSSQKIPSYKQSYSMKAGVDRSGAAKGEGEDKNASEKASPGVEKIKIKIADPPTLSRIPAPHRQVTCFAPDNFGFRAPIEMRK